MIFFNFKTAKTVILIFCCMALLYCSNLAKCSHFLNLCTMICSRLIFMLCFFASKNVCTTYTVIISYNIISMFNYDIIMRDKTVKGYWFNLLILTHYLFIYITSTDLPFHFCALYNMICFIYKPQFSLKKIVIFSDNNYNLFIHFTYYQHDI